jgi:hypothetical protein
MAFHLGAPLETKQDTPALAFCRVAGSKQFGFVEMTAAERRSIRRYERQCEGEENGSTLVSRMGWGFQATCPLQN